MTEHTKTEQRLQKTTSQFNQFADKLLVAMNGDKGEMDAAIQEAKGYNIVSSKSSKVLPFARQSYEGNLLPKKIGKLAPEQPTNLNERMRVSESVQQIIKREQARDEQLASRLKKINQKQTARIKQIEKEEARNQNNELHKLVQRSCSIQELKPSQSQKQLPNQALYHDTGLPIPIQDAQDQTNDSFQLPPAQTARASLGEYIPSKAGDQPKQFFSNRREYFNSKSQSTTQFQAFNPNPLDRSAMNESSPFIGQRNIDSVNNTQSHITKAGAAHNSSTHTVSTVWNANNMSKYVPGANSKDRADVSFLNEKQALIFSQNAAKKMALDSHQSVLVSQSQITSGNEGRDDYLQIALGLRQIGKSIMDMPNSLDDLRLLSREYMKNLGVNDDLQDEQVYLAYIEDHLKAQEKQTSSIDSSRANHSALSPIRNLADFYQRKLNKIQGQNAADFSYPAKSKSPRQTGKQQAQVVKNNQTFVDIDQMTVVDLKKLEQSPPRIQPKRKNMKVINNKAMTQFGQDAFHIRFEHEAAPPRLNAQKQQSTPQSPLEDSHKERVSADPSKTNTTVLTPRRRERNKMKSMTVKQDLGTATGPKRDDKTAQRRKLLQSLNDLADQLTKPSITNDDREQPQWIQKNLKEEANRMGLTQSNLGKPSSRQDAILLGKWFKGIIDMIESEFQKSKTLYSKQSAKKIFSTQKAHEKEISQTDQYLLIQIAHNIAIKEITRQVSVQCIERGILLKTIFDSYVRMIDLIFEDSVAQRKQLAQKFAVVCERQVYYQGEQIIKKDQVIEKKDLQIGELLHKITQAEKRETALKVTNKKLTAISYRNQAAAEENQRISLAYERQIQYLDGRVSRLLETMEPEKAAIFKKEQRRALHKIQNQATIDHEQMINSKKTIGGGKDDMSTELKIIAGEFIKTQDVGTDVDDFKHYLEDQLGGPLNLDCQMQTSLYMDNVSISQFDPYEVGAVVDKGTYIDAAWRRESRPKRMRAKSAIAQPEHKKIDKRIHMLDSASFDTSSHHTIDFLMDQRSSKSFNFGQDRRYIHIRHQKPVKRSLSHGNFNWNLLVNRMDVRFAKEEKERQDLKSGHPMAKLEKILGKELLLKIKGEFPELHEQLLDHIKLTKKLTYQFCKELLSEYNINLDEERRLQRLQYGNEYRKMLDNSIDLNDSENMSADNSGLLNLTNVSEMGDATGKQKSRLGHHNIRLNKKQSTTQFVQWNFSRQEKKKKDRLRKDHPSFPIITKLLDKFKAGKDIKEMMPVKSAARYIYNIYMGKAAEFAQEKQNQKQKVKELKDRSVSPDLLSKDIKTGKNAEKNAGSFVEGQATKKSSLPMSPKSTLRRTTTLMSPKESQRNNESGAPSLKRMTTMHSPRPSEGGANNNNEVVQDPVAKGEDLALHNNLIEWTYDYFQQRYGLKNVAEKKFTQFIGSILKYKDKFPRFKLFGRFLQLHEELTESDLKLYVDMVHNMFKNIINFAILEQDELVLLPTNRALDYFRVTFHSRLTGSSMTHCLKIIKQKQMTIQKVHVDKHSHLNNYTDAVQLDDFAEFVIMATNQLQAEKLQNIYEIFMAADLDAKGVLGFNELRTLYRLLCNQHSGDQNLQMQEIRLLFNDYAELHSNVKGQEGIKVKGISFDNFENLCLERDVFTIRQQNSFINAATKTFLNVTDNQEAFTTEFEKLSANIDNVYDRLTAAISDVMDSNVVPDKDKGRYQDMVEHMAKAVMKPVNKKIAFLTFKIVEETVKRVCLKVQVEKLMPVVPETMKSLKKMLGLSTAHRTKVQSQTATNMNMIKTKYTQQQDQGGKTHTANLGNNDGWQSQAKLHAPVSNADLDSQGQTTTQLNLLQQTSQRSQDLSHDAVVQHAEMMQSRQSKFNRDINTMVKTKDGGKKSMSTMFKSADRNPEGSEEPKDQITQNFTPQKDFGPTKSNM